VFSRPWPKGEKPGQSPGTARRGEALVKPQKFLKISIGFGKLNLKQQIFYLIIQILFTVAYSSYLDKKNILS
jgi:hypothetical protein